MQIFASILFFLHAQKFAYSHINNSAAAQATKFKQGGAEVYWAHCVVCIRRLLVWVCAVHKSIFESFLETATNIIVSRTALMIREIRICSNMYVVLSTDAVY